MFVHLQVFLIFLLFRNVHCGGGGTSRSKRWLLFTPETQYGAFVTISTPLEAPYSEVSFAYFLEANYYNVANASYFDPLLGDIIVTSRRLQREERGVDEDRDEKVEGITRSLIYHSIETTLYRQGMDGKQCLLRAICENSNTHFHHNGLLGDLLHIVLTPTSSQPEDSIDDDYYVAELLGREEAGCRVYSHACPHSVLDHISIPLT